MCVCVPSDNICVGSAFFEFEHWIFMIKGLTNLFLQLLLFYRDFDVCVYACVCVLYAYTLPVHI